MLGFTEDDFDEEGKFLLAQIKAVKAGKPLDAKRVGAILAGECDSSNTDMALLQLAAVMRRKGDKTAKQFAKLIQAAFEKHVASIAKRPRKWFSAILRGEAMKVVKGDVAFAEPLLAKAMKAKTDANFLKDVIYMVAGVDKKRAQRMYDVVQEAAKTKTEWVFKMPTYKPTRM